MDDTTGLVGGFNLQTDVTDTIETEYLEESPEVQELPDIRGFGTVHSLHQAMMIDTSGDLQDLVEAYIAETNPVTRAGILEDIIFKWAGVDSVDPSSRGGSFDAQKLGALEAFIGRGYVGTAGANPVSEATIFLDAAYKNLSDYIDAELMMQSHLSSLADLIEVNFDVETEQMTLDLSAAGTEIANQINLNETAGEALLKDFTRTIEILGLKEISNYQEFSEAISVIDPSYAFMMDTANLNFIYGTTGNDSGLDSISGTGVGDAIFGLEGNDSIHARMGDDYVDGGAGNDTIETCYGNDIIIGGLGNDSLTGGNGNDTYIYSYGDGRDTIYDVDGDGTVVFDGISLDEVTFSAKDGISTSWGDMVYDREYGLPTTPAFWVHLKDGSGSVGVINLTQSVVFEDGEITYAEIFNNLEEYGTDGNDIIYNTDYDEIINGLAGNDTIFIEELYYNSYNTDIDEDTIYCGDGNDSLDSISHGNMLIYGGAGDDTINASYRGNHTIVGGTGDDELLSGWVDDTYIFSEGDGNDTIYDVWGYNDTIVFDGIDLSEAKFSAKRMLYSVWIEDLITINYGNLNDTLYTRQPYVTSVLNFIENYVFDDVTLTYNDVISRLETLGTDSSEFLYGSDYNETIRGFAGNDNITAYAGNDTIDGGLGADTMVGGLGDDVYYVDVAGDVVTENSGEGTDTVNSSVTYTLGANVENLTLAGSDSINGTGNNLNNSVIGNSADNIINGGVGADTMIGGAGNDTYFVDNVGDVVTESAGEGIDTVNSSGTYTLGANVENLTLTGTSAIDGTGNELNNILTGNSASNVLTGGMGNDTYFVDNTDDVVIENVGEGIDSVNSSATYTLSANVENLILTGSLAINGTGNDLNNSITGNSADNIIDGGLGNDTMVGGVGDDTYTVDNIDDVVTENAGEGTDIINSSITYTLAANIENLTLTGTSAINGTGNDLNNLITGNSGNNSLTGGAGNDSLDGGSGNDTMLGGIGNDTYYVDTTGDVITENTGEGTDTVNSSIAYALGNNLENLTLTGTSNINGTGNSLNNVLTGNSGNNSLDGGTGADTMSGGTGDDTYYIKNAGDVAVENTGEGIDTVHSWITTTLGANIENLTLRGSVNPLNGTGNDLDNVIIGTGYNNVLTGLGGNDTLDGGPTGADTLVGGAGNDVYYVNNGDIVTENAGEGTDTVNSSITYTLTNNVENLILTGTTAINGTGNSLDNILTGNSAVNTLDGGAGNDTYITGAGNDIISDASGNDTYLFNIGDNLDTLTDSAGTDIINLGSLVSKNKVAFFTNGSNVFSLDFGDTVGVDRVAVNSWNNANNQIETIHLNDGSYLTNTEVNQVIQNMTAYAAANSITLASVDDVRNNAELLNIVNSAWHT